MKRSREMEKRSEIKSANEELSLMVKFKNNTEFHSHYIPTRPFLQICNLVIQVLDKIGPTMAVLRQDINQNIERLEKQCESDPTLYSNIVEIVKKEVDERNERKGHSCSKALVWLTRLAKEVDEQMEQIIEDSYNISLKSYHGWVSAAAFKECLKLIPDRQTFISLLKPKDEDNNQLSADVETLIELLQPLLEDIHSIMILYRLNKLKST